MTIQNEDTKPVFFKEERMMCVLCGRFIEEPGIYVHFAATLSCFNGINSCIDESYKDAKKDYNAHYRCAVKRGMWIDTCRLNTWEVVYK